jgi:hypothetical protein
MRGIRQAARLARHAAVLGIALTALTACVAPPRIVGPIHTPIAPRSVMIFVPPLVPKHYTVVARLDPVGLTVGGCTYYTKPSSYVLRLDLRDAARLGANGLLLIPWHTKPGYKAVANGCLGAPVRHAWAIFVPTDRRPQ